MSKQHSVPRPSSIELRWGSSLEYALGKNSVKGCVHYNCASLFFKSKRKHLSD